jgi:uncharacterized protein (TIGR02147 family)
LVAIIDDRVNVDSIFGYDDYKKFVRDFIAAMPHRGRGQYRRMAEHMRVHTTLLSHVFRGAKELTSEQACAVAAFLRLEELDADYLLALVERSRAGTHALRLTLDRRLAALRERHQHLEHRVPGARALSHQERTTFYSQWYYSAVRLAASLPAMNDEAAIAERLDLPRGVVRTALAFLLDAELLARTGTGYRLVAKRTHLGASSPLAPAHHRNWRVQAMNRYEHMSARDFAFTSPISLSRSDFAVVRELLVDAVAKVTKIVEPSSCESLALLNVDWLQL